jgi:AzlC protein
MEEPLPGRGAILRAAIGIGLYAGAFGASFGAISVASGLTLAQTMVLSLVMFTGASQFAFVGVAAGGGTPFAAVAASLLLAIRNAFYCVPLSEILHPTGLARLGTAHFVIDETTGMAVSQATPRAQRYAFWTTGVDPVLPVAAGQPGRGTHRPRHQSRRGWAGCCGTCRFLGLALAVAAAPGGALGGHVRCSCGPRPGTCDAAWHPGCRCRRRGAGCRPTPGSRRH